MKSVTTPNFSALISRARTASVARPEGKVHNVVGLLLEVVGLVAPVGAELEIPLPDRKLRAEIIGFRNGHLLAAPLGSTNGVEPGTPAVLLPGASLVEVDDRLLGRVIDAFGRPLDDRPLPAAQHTVPLDSPPPAPFGRRPVAEPFVTRVRAIDSLLTLGRGQRIGLFAGTGVGKSTLLGMLCRNSEADVIVVGLVGERGREVGDFVRGALGPEGLKRSVVVAATSDSPAYVRVRGALRATAIAEHFRNMGKHVLLVMDSVTRYAMALREASLAAGEPPLQKGYTPSVFAALPALLERAGNCDGPGSITAIYTVLVEGDDLSDPIADTTRGILDGHIVLTRKLADRGHFPAIDVLKSISRLASEIAPEEHLRAASHLRAHMAAYADAEDLIQIGAYVPGSDRRVDAARAVMPKLQKFLAQGTHDAIPREQTEGEMFALAQESTVP